MALIISCLDDRQLKITNKGANSYHFSRNFLLPPGGFYRYTPGIHKNNYPPYEQQFENSQDLRILQAGIHCQEDYFGHMRVRFAYYSRHEHPPRI
jgi:hypothetical protein